MIIIMQMHAPAPNGAKSFTDTMQLQKNVINRLENVFPDNDTI